jgi:hypothetical protein
VCHSYLLYIFLYIDSPLSFRIVGFKYPVVLFQVLLLVDKLPDYNINMGNISTSVMSNVHTGDCQKTLWWTFCYPPVTSGTKSTCSLQICDLKYHSVSPARTLTRYQALTATLWLLSEEREREREREIGEEGGFWHAERKTETRLVPRTGDSTWRLRDAKHNYLYSRNSPVSSWHHGVWATMMSHIVIHDSGFTGPFHCLRAKVLGTSK